jgi:hypothetical protein
MNKNNIKKGAENIVDYLNYCNQLQEIVESRNNSNIHRKQINNLNEIKRDLDFIDLAYDFFDEMNGEVNKFEKKNKEIEKKINKLVEK